MKRIFVRGPSRSGGTLMVTILDAHPDVAMAYEMYEHLLKPQEPDGDGVEAFAAHLVADETRGFRRRLEAAVGVRSTPTNALLKRFIDRARRGGVELADLVKLLRQHRDEGLGFATTDDRLAFVERVGVCKMRRERKQHWGTKIASNYEEVHRRFSDAYYLFMLRDGRDIAASRKLVGDFRQSVEHVAEDWTRQVEKFRQFAARPEIGPGRARIVPYERLTAHPEAELCEIMAFLDLPWDDRLVRHHDLDLTLYRNPVGHLSANQVNRPINTSSHQRWRRDLTPEEIAAFQAKAGAMLAEFGYAEGT